MSRLISSTLGALLPGWRHLSVWIEVYRQVILARPLSQKTLANRFGNLRHIEAEFGDHYLARIRPHEIAQFIVRLHATHPHAARRVLIEFRELFAEAVAYGWVDRNPAESVRNPLVRVLRPRLSIEQWMSIHDWSTHHSPPWVPRMMMLALVSGQRRADLQKMRFDDARDGYLHVVQHKTGVRLRLPLALRLDAVGVSLGDVVEDCRDYSSGHIYLLRKSTGGPLVCNSLTARFEEARDQVMGPPARRGAAPSLHECRSLAERLYRAQGVDTRTLLGHKRQSMTDQYNDDRGLSGGQWKTLSV